MGYTLITPKEKKSEKGMLVTQSNKLVEARYTLTLYEQRLVLMMISMIEPSDEDFKNYAIKVSDFGDLIGLKNKNLYSQIKKILVKLRERTLVIEEGNDYLVTGWISSAKYISNEGIVELSFDANLKPFLLQLKQEFTKQRLGTIIKFKGIYTIRIYGLLKQFQKIGTRVFTLDEFRKTLGIEEDKYLLFNDLRRRTIVQAQKEFNQKNEQGVFLSDINFEFEAIKRGRRVTGLKFIIIKQSTQPSVSIKQTLKKTLSPVLTEYEALGIQQSTTLPYLKEQGEEALQRTLSIFEKDKKAGQIRSNEQGYLVTLLKSGAGVISEAEKKEEEKKKKERLEKLKKQKKEAKKTATLLLKKEYLREQKDKYLSSIGALEREHLLKTCREKHKDNSFIVSKITDIKSVYIQDDINKLVQEIEGYVEGEKVYLKEGL